MFEKNLEDVIRSHVPFVHGTTSAGWNRVYCEVCGDGSRKKGPRGGWLFSGEMVFFHCFNCGVEGNFEPNRDQPFSKEMRNILDAFNIPKNEYNFIVVSAKIAGSKPLKPRSPEYTIPKIEMPEHFYKLQDASIDNDVAASARRFLKENYGLPHDCYDFYLSTGISNGNPKEKAIAKSLANRIIIPFYRGSDLIYYQARALDAAAQKKYINAETARGSIIFGMDKLYKNVDKPLYILEGAFDAMHLDGIAVLENKMSKTQIDMINKSPRKKILVPDRSGDSRTLAEQAIDEGWNVSLPDIGKSCKDVSEAIVKFGKLYVVSSIVERTYEAARAKLLISFI